MRGMTGRDIEEKKDAHVSTESDFVVSQPALRVCITERDVTDDEGIVGDGRLEALEPIPYVSTHHLSSLTRNIASFNHRRRTLSVHSHDHNHIQVLLVAPKGRCSFGLFRRHILHVASLPMVLRT